MAVTRVLRDSRSPRATHDHEEVVGYALDDGAGVRVEIHAVGATLARVSLPGPTGEPLDVVGRPNVMTAGPARAHPYNGTTVGRYCRNVTEGTFVLDGVVHHLDRNDKQHHMHGGADGFDKRLWQAHPDPTASAVRLSLTSPDGDQGYPGELTAEAEYRLDGTTLTISYQAATTASTIVDLTNHAYWNLAGSSTIDDHTLSIDADNVVQVGSGMVPDPSALRPVANTVLDYRRPRLLEDHAIDRYFVLNSGGAVTLAHPPSGRSLRVRTNRPGFGVYTADRTAPGRSGIAMQPSGFPDAPNRPDFPSVRLDPGQTYTSRTTYELTL